jgi:hypothetical protein
VAIKPCRAAIVANRPSSNSISSGTGFFSEKAKRSQSRYQVVGLVAFGDNAGRSPNLSDGSAVDDEARSSSEMIRPSLAADPVYQDRSGSGPHHNTLTGPGEANNALSSNSLAD